VNFYCELDIHKYHKGDVHKRNDLCKAIFCTMRK